MGGRQLHGFEDEAPSVPQHPLPRSFTSGWERKKKKTFSPSGLRPTLPDKGALIQRGGLLLGASLSLQIPGSQQPLQLTGNWIHE